MGNFIAEAFVRIKCPHKRHNVMCKVNLSDRDMLLGQFFQMERMRLGVSPNSVIFYPNHEKIDKDVINCNHYANGDEDLAVKLFLELAKMRDDTDKQQWYKADWGFFKAEDTNHVLREARCCMDRCKSIGSVHKLTPLELAEAVMRGDVKL